MIDLLLAISLSSLVIAYWVFCRKQALKHQQKASDLIEAYFDDQSVKEEDKEALYKDYVYGRKWYIFPLYAFYTPFLIIQNLIIHKGRLILNSEPRDNQKAYDQAFDAIMKMMLARNPLISIMCILFISIWFLFTVTLSVLLNRASSLPTTYEIVNMFEALSDGRGKKAH